MERNANYALVGGAAILLFIGLIVFLVWLSQLQFNQEFDLYDVHFQGPVRGLSEGGEVYFNGIRVGEVTDIALDQEDPNRVITRIRVDGQTPVRTDSRAQLEPQGITGINYIQVSAGSPSARLLKNTVERGEIPVIRSSPSLFAGLIEGGGTVLARTVQALDQVNRLLSEENIRSLSTTMANVETLSTELAARRQIIADLQQSLEQINRTTREFERLAIAGRTVAERDVPAVMADVRRATEDARAVAADARLVAADARRTMNSIEGSADQLNANVLPQLTETLAAVEETSETLDRVAREIQENPRALITRGNAVEREIAQ